MIYIHKGDSTVFANVDKFLTFNLITELSLVGFKAVFNLGGITRTINDISSKTFEVILTSAETSILSYGKQYGELKIIDSNNNIKTATNTIPFCVTPNVIDNVHETIECEVPESTEIDINITIGSGGGGGTSDFDQLTNRPSYNGTAMTHTTNIPSVPTKTSDLNNDSGYITKSVNDLTNYTTTTNLNTLLSTKQDVGDASLTTSNKTVVGGINEVNSIAKLASKAMGFASYQDLITLLNSSGSSFVAVGQSLFIQTLDVPDLWVYSVDQTSETYTYVSDEAIINELTTNGYIKVGYYKLSMLETLKQDLTNYVQNSRTIAGLDLSQNRSASDLRTALNVEDGAEVNDVTDVQITGTSILTNKVANIPYASTSTAGVVKVNNTYGIRVDGGGNLYAVKATDSEIGAKSSSYAIIVPNNLDYAIEKGLGDNSLTWTDAEKLSACTTIGTTKVWTGTLSAYNALGTYDDNTDYRIIE